MTLNQYSLEALVVRIQNEFLGRPTLRLTLPDAVQRFDIDKTTGLAVLDALVDARVLTKTRAGAYCRFFPRDLDRRSPRLRARHDTADWLAASAA